MLWYYAAWAGDGLGGASNWKHPGRFAWYNAGNSDASGPNANGSRFIAAGDDHSQGFVKFFIKFLFFVSHRRLAVAHLFCVLFFRMFAETLIFFVS